MWNETLVQRAAAYRSGVLTIVEPDGYPASVRCSVGFDGTRQVITFTALPAYAVGWSGRACLLLHRHNAVLEEQYELLIKGTLVEDAGAPVLQPANFVTGTGSPTTDQMPHAGAPIELIQFMLLGRRKARDYIRKRGAPWPPIRFDRLLRVLNEPDPRAGKTP